MPDFIEHLLAARLERHNASPFSRRKRAHPNYDLYAIATKGQMAEAELRALAGAHFAWSG
jgi:hypothetical protein